MTTHRSLRGVDTLVGERSVLTRVERIDQLQKAGKLDPEQASPFGLPKVRTKFKVSTGKKGEAKKPTEESAAEGAEKAEGEGGGEGGGD
jgi:small basic protein (TIGR04137 family)